jgi:5-methylcytosine-specific restriction endonuclease McrA
MPWRNDPDKRRRDNEHYRDPEFVRNRIVVLRRAGGRCEQCSKRTRRLQVDHKVPLSVRIDHSLGNLWALCSGPGSCHAKKTAQEGRGYRGGKRREIEPPLQSRTVW